MPEAADRNSADRSSGSANNMHTRENGEMILIPRDALEGLGNFLETDANGDPVGWRLGRPERRDGRRAYIGLSAHECYRQTQKPLPADRPSHVVDYPLVALGQLPPNSNTPLLAPLPKPDPATVIKLTTDKLGYPSSTTSSPYWYAWALVKNGRLLTLHSPPVPFQLANGQGFEVLLPTDVPAGLQVALLLSEPKKSRPDRPGPMWVQRIVDPATYMLPTFPLTGPYRKDERLAAVTNETVLPPPGTFKAKKGNQNVASRVANYKIHLTFEDASGETTLSVFFRSVAITPDARYSIEEDQEAGTEAVIAGRGAIRVNIPQAIPPGTTGWRIRVYETPRVDGTQFTAGWCEVVDKLRGHGGDKPIPIGRKFVDFAGWHGDEDPYGRNDNVVLVQSDPPTSNTTGVPDPDARPETPLVTGSSRPEAGIPYFIRVVDTLNGRESPPSDAVEVSDLQANEIMAIVFADPDNEIPNGTFTETDPNRLPLYWQSVQTNGKVEVVGENLEISTSASVASATATPSATSAPIAVATTTPDIFYADYEIVPPPTGQPEGFVEVDVRQKNAAGAVVQTDVITQRATPGEYEDEITLNPVGGAQPAYHADAEDVDVQIRFVPNAASNKNGRAKINGAGKRRKNHKQRRRRKKHRRQRPTLPPPPPGTTPEHPPIPPTPPPLAPTPDPDRPKTLGTVEETLGFETGIPAAPWQQLVTGTATLTAGAAGAISGAAGLIAKKAAGGTLSSAQIRKAYAPDPKLGYRHARGFYSQYRFPTFPTSGSLVVRELARQSDGRWIARLIASRDQQVSELTIDEAPTAPGPATINLGNTTMTATVASTPQVVNLDLTSGPTVGGSVQVDLDGGSPHTVVVGGTTESLRIQFGRPSRTGFIQITLAGYTKNFKVQEGWTGADVATAVWQSGFPGWWISRSNATLTFTYGAPGPISGHSTNPNGTGTSMTLVMVTEGGPESITAFASRLAANPPPNWTGAVHASDATIVVYTATTGGARPTPQFFPNGTGAAATLTTTPGSMDTKEQLAAKFRALLPADHAVSGSANLVRITANTTGARQYPTYDPGATGADGTMRVTTPGTNGDVTLAVQHADGYTEHRRLLSGIVAATVCNLDLAVSGAHGEDAIVTAWASTGAGGAATVEHTARVEEVDLTGIGPDVLSIGVLSETSAAMTWEVHVDDVRVTDRGLTWFRDHTHAGEWIQQVVGSYHPTLPTSQDLLLKDGSCGVEPGGEYVLSLFARPKNAHASTPAQILVATARSSLNTSHVVAVAGQIPANSESPWTEYVSAPFTIPPNCHRLDLESRDISGGLYVIQEAVCSPGTTPDRTGLYATNGTYQQIFDLQTNNAIDQFRFWTRERTRLLAPTNAPAGTTIAVTFSAADSEDGPWTPFEPDPTTVPDKRFVRVNFTASCPLGNDTPEILANSPSVDWDLKISANRRMSTLLTADRTELPGGAAFESILPWSKRDPAQRIVLPSGQLHDDPDLFEPVGVLPPSELWLFNSKACQYLHANWKKIFCIEAYGEILYVKLSAPPSEFEPQTTNIVEDPDGTRHGIFKTKLAFCQVLAAVPLP